MTPRDLLVDYWLRAIKISVAVTMLAVVALTALPFIPHHGHIRLPLYIPTLAAAVGGALPWSRSSRGDGCSNPLPGCGLSMPGVSSTSS